MEVVDAWLEDDLIILRVNDSSKIFVEEKGGVIFLQRRGGVFCCRFEGFVIEKWIVESIVGDRNSLQIWVCGVKVVDWEWFEGVESMVCIFCYLLLRSDLNLIFNVYLSIQEATIFVFPFWRRYSNVFMRVLNKEFGYLFGKFLHYFDFF